MKKFQFVFSLLFFTLCLLTGCKQTSGNSSASAPYEYDRVDIDLGDVLIEGGPRTFEFELRNNNCNSFYISRVVTECDCTKTEYEHKFLKKGEAQTISITLDPSGIGEGDFVRLVGVYTSIKSTLDTLYIRGVAKHK